MNWLNKFRQARKIPAELREKVFRLKGKAADWKKNYDELRAMYDEHIADWKKFGRTTDGVD